MIGWFRRREGEIPEDGGPGCVCWGAWAMVMVGGLALSSGLILVAARWLAS